MKKAIINIGSDAIGRAVDIDLETLLVTRALVQGASGAGKSRFLRRLAEQAFGKVPIIILDPEGEFASLREKFDFVLAGRGGETPADPRSAAMLATKLLELRASAVIDLYDMKPLERHSFVKLFLQSLMNAEKRLWHPLLLMVDEAHRYCPERSAGESEASEAMTATATDGRKRGICSIFATQRLGKLRKDAAAELLNVFIGQTFIDIDRGRAADALGVPKGKEQHELFDRLKVLPRGSFYGLGQAVSLDALLIRSGDVQTTHPKVGAKTSGTVPPAPAAIKALLPQLADLPKQAEDKARTEAEYRKEIVELRKQLKAAPLVAIPKPDKSELLVAEQRGIDKGRQEVGRVLSAHRTKLNKFIESLRNELQKPVDRLAAFEKETIVTASEVAVPPRSESTTITPPREHRPHVANIGSVLIRFLVSLLVLLGPCVLQAGGCHEAWLGSNHVAPMHPNMVPYSLGVLLSKQTKVLDIDNHSVDSEGIDIRIGVQTTYDLVRVFWKNEIAKFEVKYWLVFDLYRTGLESERPVGAVDQIKLEFSEPGCLFSSASHTPTIQFDIEPLMAKGESVFNGLGLSHDSIQGPKRRDSSQQGRDNHSPVGDSCWLDSFVPVVRLILGTAFLLGGFYLYLDFAHTPFAKRLSLTVFALGFICLLAPIPWDVSPLHLCGKQHGQKHGFHSGDTVTQESRLGGLLALWAVRWFVSPTRAIGAVVLRAVSHSHIDVCLFGAVSRDLLAELREMGTSKHILIDSFPPEVYITLAFVDSAQYRFWDSYQRAAHIGMWREEERRGIWDLNFKWTVDGLVWEIKPGRYRVPSTGVVELGSSSRGGVTAILPLQQESDARLRRSAVGNTYHLKSRHKDKSPLDGFQGFGVYLVGLSNENGLPDRDPGIGDNRHESHNLKDKALVVAGIFLDFIGFMLLYKTWSKVSFDRPRNISVTRSVLVILGCFGMVWIGMGAILFGLGLV